MTVRLLQPVAELEALRAELEAALQQQQQGGDVAGEDRAARARVRRSESMYQRIAAEVQAENAFESSTTKYWLRGYALLLALVLFYAGHQE